MAITLGEGLAAAKLAGYVVKGSGLVLPGPRKKIFRALHQTEMRGRLLHGVSHAIRDFLYIKKHDPVEVHFYRCCLQVVESVKHLFDLVTGTNTNACIKLCVKNPPDHVKTFCRDTSSFQRAGARDKPTAIRENTDFTYLYDEPDKYSYFLGSNLQKAHKRSKYFNSHTDFGEHYRSTIVWPIRAYRSETQDFDIVGFLCVDSKDRAAFQEADVQIGASIADALYIPLEFYSEVLKNTHD